MHLITRPRRFGKTLNLSMIRYFFEAPPPHGGNSDSPPNAALFNGMSIAEHPQCREYMGQYPVIHLSFKDAKVLRIRSAWGLSEKCSPMNTAGINTCGIPAFWKTGNGQNLKNFCTMRAQDQDCAQSIEYLSSWLHRAYGKPVYILLDEYDTPLHAAYADNFYDELIAFIRSFMVQSFKDNPNLKQRCHRDTQSGPGEHLQRLQ